MFYVFIIIFAQKKYNEDVSEYYVKIFFNEHPREIEVLHARSLFSHVSY